MVYWELFAIVTTVIVPSERLYPYILNWLYRRALEQEQRMKNKEIIKSVKFIFTRMMKMELMQRSYIPSHSEMKLISQKKSLPLQVYLFTGNFIILPIESYTKFRDIKKNLVARLGISSRSDYYGIIEVRESNNSIKERYADDDELVFDTIGFWDQC